MLEWNARLLTFLVVLITAADEFFSIAWNWNW